MAAPEKFASQLLTVEKLQTVVRTMKTLSAVSIQQYEMAAKSIKSYRETVELGLQVLLMQYRVGVEGPVQGSISLPAKFIVFGSDHGLCGRFNESIVDHALDYGSAAETPLGAIEWYAVGDRVATVMEIRGLEVAGVFETPSVASGLSNLSRTIIRALDRNAPGELMGKVYIAHNIQSGEKVRHPALSTLLPIDRVYLCSLARRGWQARGLPIVRMEPAHLFSSLIRQYLFARVFEAGAQSLAAEHAQRLTAMQNAEQNISERCLELQGEYRQARQNEITSEILDIVSGYEVLTAAKAN